MALIVEGEDRHAVEVDALVAARLGVDDGLALAAALAGPEWPAAPQCARFVAEQNGFVTLRLFLHDRRKRIVDGGGENAEQEGHDRRRRNELPGRYAGRTGDHQFQPPR